MNLRANPFSVAGLLRRMNLLFVTIPAILASYGSTWAVQVLDQQQWTTPAPVTEVNTEYEEWAPFISFDGLSLYFSRVRTDSFYYGRIYQARRDKPSGLFASVIEISELNEPDTHILCPWVSPDNLRMYYHKEHGGRFALAVSKRASVNDLWPKGADIAELNMLSDRVVMPKLTADELTVFFGAYGVTAGHQEWDIWIAARADRNSPFDSGVTTSAAISSPFMDQAPSASPDGLILYFASSRNDGNTSQLFRASRLSLIEPFVNVEHLAFFDTPGGHTYHPCISSDGTALYFMRQLGEDRSSRDIYVSYYIAARRDYYVDAVKGHDNNDGLSPSAAFATIQKGIDSAQNGDKVTVYPGTYLENINFTGKNITLTSTDSNNPNVVAATIIDGGQKGSVVTFKSGESPDCTLNGFTVTNGQAGQGGGVCCTDSSPHLIKCTFSRNSAAAPGGGMFAASGKPTLTDCTFDENSATWGGAFFCEPGSGPTLVRCTFTRNSATSGGAIFCEYASIVITNSLFSENAATQGAAILAYSDANVFIANCTFIGNKAAEGATLACKSGSGKGKVTLLNSILWNGGNEIWLGDSFTITVTYSDVQGGWPGEGNINADPRFAGLPEGLLAHWKFDEQQGDIAYDSVGGNHGTIRGAQRTTGWLGGALSFDGVADYVSLSGNAVTSTEFTVSAWANHRGLGGGRNNTNMIFSQRDDDATPASRSIIVLATERLRDSPYAFAGIQSSAGVLQELTHPKKDYNEWHHYAMTVNTSDFILYIDGLEVSRAANNQKGDYVTSVDYVDIGRHRYFRRDNGFFNGVIDEVAVWDRALSPEEIRRLYPARSYCELLPDSPCIDAGDPAYVPGPNETDLDGDSRVVGQAIDMGAFECQPQIELSVNEFEFEVVVGFSNPTDQILLLRNAGAGTLNWQISCDCDWLQVHPDSGRSKGEGNTAWLRVNTAGLSADQYNCTLTVSGSPAMNSPQTVQVRLLVRKNCFPDTPQYAQQYADFLEYATVGADPSCWCASPSDGSHYQCDGDASGRTQTFTNYRVFTDDLALIIKNWKKEIDTADPCADIDHKAQLFQRYRVFTNDLSMLITNWKKRDDQLANNCPRPDGQ